MKVTHPSLKAALVLAPCLFMAGPVAAQTPHVLHAPALTAAELAMLDARASDLIGMQVRSPNGEVLGKLEDLVLDVASAHVRYAVLAYGGSLGYGTRLAAFPLALFRPGPREGELVLYVTPEQFRDAPSFEASAWPNWREARYAEEVDRFFLKDDEVLVKEADTQLMRAADLVGRDVNDPSGRGVGDIEGLVVNLGNGQVRYIVLGYATGLGFNRKLVPLPITAFRFPARPDVDATVYLDAERIAKARPFREEDWPDLRDSLARREIETEVRQLETESQEAVRATGGGEPSEADAER